MTDKIDVLRLAREAGIPSALLSEVGLIPADDAVFRFAAFVMEECAKQCEQMAKRSERDLYGSVRCAAAIRERKPK